jgi:hypothetical protein
MDKYPAVLYKILVVGVIFILSFQITMMNANGLNYYNSTIDEFQLIQHIDRITFYVDDNNTEGPWDGTPEHPYQTIIQAVQNASDGDTIFVFNGTYKGFTAKKQLNFIGESNIDTIIRSKPTKLKADWINFTNFMLLGKSCGLDAAVQAAGNNVTISHCKIYADSVYGIEVGEYNYERDITISDCEVKSCPYAGILIYCSHHCVIKNCSIHHCKYGEPLYIGAGILIMFAGSYYSSYHTIYNCEIYECDNGITFERDRNNVVNCNIYRCRKGLNIYDSCNNIITSCTIENNSVAGCYIYPYAPMPSCKQNKVIGNIIINNKKGVYCEQDSKNNIIHHNNFYNSSQNHAVDYGTNNIWDDGSQGNHWDDYTGEDNDGDGIGDTPYYILGGKKDNYPLMNPFLLNNLPPDIPDISGPTIGKQWVSYSFTTLALDPNYDPLYYQFDWGDGNFSRWVGPFGYCVNGCLNHIWTESGTYNVRVKAKDIKGERSPWSQSHIIIIESNNRPDPPDIPDGPLKGIVGNTYNYSTSTFEGDGEQIYYWFDWGDGGTTGWIGLYNSGEIVEVSHKFEKTKTHEIKAKAKDIHGAVSQWSPILYVEIINHPPKNPILIGNTTWKIGEKYKLTYYTWDEDDHRIGYKYKMPGFDGSFCCVMSNKTKTYTYTFEEAKNYTFKIKAYDVYGAESEWSELTVMVPRNTEATSSLLLKILEHFPLLERLLNLIRMR